MLIAQINERLVAIGWSSGDSVSVTGAMNITCEMHGKRGSVTIIFKFPEGLSMLNLKPLVQFIKKEFR